MLLPYFIYYISGALGGMLASCFSYIADHIGQLERQIPGPAPINENAPLLPPVGGGQPEGRWQHNFFHQLARIYILQSCVHLGSAAGYFLGGLLLENKGFFNIFLYLSILNAVNFVYVLFILPAIPPAPLTHPQAGLPEDPNQPPAATICPSLRCILIPFQLFWDSVKTAFIEPAHTRIGWLKVMLALSILWFYIFSERIQVSLDYQFLLPAIPPAPLAPPHAGLPENPNQPPAATRCPSLRCILIPFQLFWESVKTTFIEPAHTRIGWLKVMLALSILWFYIFSERIQVSLYYQFLLLPPSNITQQDFGQFEAYSELTTWILVSAVLPLARWCLPCIHQITLNILAILGGLIMESAALLLLAYIRYSNCLTICICSL